MKKEHIPYILLGLLIIAVGILLFVGFSKGNRPDDLYKDLIEAKEREIDAVIRERDTYRAWKDAEVAENARVDSLLKEKLKTTIIKYENIPVNVRNYNRDELRRAVKEYAGN